MIVVLANDPSLSPGDIVSDVDAANPYGLDERKSCGVRCCVFLDQYLGGNHSYNDVLSYTPVSSRGSNLEDIATTLRSFGYNVDAVRANARYLRSLKDPAILAVRRGGVDHFLVALQYNAAGDSFLTFDPPRKLAHTSYATIAGEYRGYALIVSKTGDDPRRGMTIRAGIVRVLLVAAGLIGLLCVWIRRHRSGGTSKAANATLALIVTAALPVSGCNQSSARNLPKRGAAPSETALLERDVGQVVQGTPLEVEFVLRNTSGTPFDVIDVRKSCACQSVTLSKTKGVLPDEEVPVTVYINTKGQMGGFSRDVIVATTSREPSLREIRLLIQGEVVTLVRAIPSEVSFGDVDYGSTHRKTLRVEAFAPAIARALTSVSSTEMSLSPSFKIVNEDLIEVAIEAAFDQSVAGNLFGRIDLHFDHPKVKLLSVDVNAHVRSRIRVVPRVVIVNGHTNNWPKSLRVESTDGTEFGLLSVAAPGGIVAAFTPGKAPSFIVELAREKATPQLVGGAHTLSIVTDVPGGESVRVPFVVQLQP